MKRIVLDTNAILRFLLKDVPNQHELVENLIKKAKSKKILIVIPEIVIFETIFTLKSYYGYNKDTLSEIIESLVSTDYLEVENREIFIRSLDLYKKGTLEFVDSFILIKTEYFKADLFTFDKKLGRVRQYLLRNYGQNI